MDWLFNSLFAFASPFLGVLGGLFAAGVVFVSTLLLGIGAVVVGVWFAFNSTYRAIFGRSFIFTGKMARILSMASGAALAAFFGVTAFPALKSGTLKVYGGHGRGWTDYWDYEPKRFVFDLLLTALEFFVVWEVVASLLIAAAKVSEKTKPSPPTPPTQTAPR